MTTIAEEFQTDPLVENACHALECAARLSSMEVQADGSWRGELRSDASITSKYITLLYSLRIEISQPELWIQWLVSQQHVDGSWGLAPDIPGDISVTVETYLALRVLGLDREHSALRKAKDFALCSGGVARVRILTRILLATFGLFPWSAVPELPSELILLSRKIPFSVCQMASWARGTIIPLLLVRHHQPVFALPNGLSETNTYLDELWCDPSCKQVPYSPSLWKPWKTDPISFTFTAIDTLLHAVNGMRDFSWRTSARSGCVSWILENLDQNDWGNVFPPIHAGILALVLEGHSLKSPPVCRGLEALQALIWSDQTGKRIQPAITSVRDTILMTIGLLDMGLAAGNNQVSRSLDWVKGRQHTCAEGKEFPTLTSDPQEGGFNLGGSAKCASDVGDTASAIIAIVRQDPTAVNSTPVLLALRWLLGMQNSDGGWGALDHENNRLFLNKMAFSDMDNMCDPSAVDITGRVLETFGRLMHPPRTSDEVGGTREVLAEELYCSLVDSASRAITYLVSQQEKKGCWYGRWGANYIYGTSAALCGLSYFRSLSPQPSCTIYEKSDTIRASISAGTDWLVSVQRPDGGWGETLLTYHDPSKAGQGSTSTASQTAWALMGLLSNLPTDHPAVVRGVQFLVRTQKPMSKVGASWTERLYTGTAFPKHLFLGYSFYSHYFPMMALGRYVALAKENSQDRLFV